MASPRRDVVRGHRHSRCGECSTNRAADGSSKFGARHFRRGFSRWSLAETTVYLLFSSRSAPFSSGAVTSKVIFPASRVVCTMACARPLKAERLIGLCPAHGRTGVAIADADQGLAGPVSREGRSCCQRLAPAWPLASTTSTVTMERSALSAVRALNDPQ
jgi:hypothetical protein